MYTLTSLNIPVLTKLPELTVLFGFYPLYYWTRQCCGSASFGCRCESGSDFHSIRIRDPDPTSSYTQAGKLCLTYSQQCQFTLNLQIPHNCLSTS
jgi:hypothetical protein